MLNGKSGEVVATCIDVFLGNASEFGQFGKLPGATPGTWRACWFAVWFFAAKSVEKKPEPRMNTHAPTNLCAC